MKASEEWMLWVDEATVNFNYQRGMYPTVERDGGSSTKLFYCYYTQSNEKEEEDGMICIYVYAKITNTYKLPVDEIVDVK